MTLARKMSIAAAALTCSLVLIAAVASWGLGGLSADLDETLRGYGQLRDAYIIKRYVDRADTMFRYSRGLLQRDEFIETVATALQRTAELEKSFDPQSERRARAANARAALALVHRDAVAGTIHLDRWRTALQTSEQFINAEIDAAREVIQGAQQRADRRRQGTIITVALATVALVALMILVSVWLYRSVMSPLRRVRQGVRDVAGGEFRHRLDAEPDREFGELVDDFNDMAQQLDELYHQLSEKVEQKSRELVRSERLASVGFLAAGVAHEINNPLAIMSGHAEMSLRKLEKGADGDALNEARHTLEIVRDEAFRCKSIIEKLLTMARGESERSCVDLRQVVRDVIDLVRGLSRYADRDIDIDLGDAPLPVMADANELKQVMLNLTVNALEATETDGGRVSIGGRRQRDDVVIQVQDNGGGMSEQTLSHVFEPFFSAKRGSSERGVGLGLSITHAIIESHGGHINAVSEGPGKGSRFIIELPAATTEVMQTS